MKVITGKYRGRNIKTIEDSATRPTLGRVKESLFSVIQDEIADAKILDLFAGSGSLGIECLSRYAAHCTFVELNPKAVALLNENLSKVEASLYNIISSDYMVALSRLASQGVKFDIIFIDPPYISDNGISAIDYIIAAGLLKDQGIIIYEHNSLNLLQDLDKSYIIEFERSYGQTTIDIIRRV